MKSFSGDPAVVKLRKHLANLADAEQFATPLPPAIESGRYVLAAVLQRLVDAVDMDEASPRVASALETAREVLARYGEASR